MNDDELDDQMLRALRDLDPPPPTPREEIWARIQAEREGAALERRDRVPRTSRTTRTTWTDRANRTSRIRWLQWSGAIAATFVIGLGLGRLTLHPPVIPETAGRTTEGETTGAGGAVPAAYRVATNEHLERTETLLASVAVRDRGRGAEEISSWARDLLTDTRLLLGSRVVEDAPTRRLLEDLELVLTQIAGIPAARADEEVELIQEGIHQSDVLLRLRAATAAPRFANTSRRTES